MRHTTRVVARLFILLSVAGVCGPGAAQPAAKAEACPACPCKNPQSPRRLTAADWNWTSATPAVRRRDADSIFYAPRPGVSLILRRCSQHYHCRIENVQGCPGESAPPAAGASNCPDRPPVDSWVEIHTAYHAGALCRPTPEGLDCCTAEPVVVVAHHAKVTGQTIPPPLALHFGPPSAEWSGSSTNPEPPECKPAAYWAFALGCSFRVSQRQLAPFTHPEEARALQPTDRLSRDLTHVVVRTPPR